MAFDYIRNINVFIVVLAKAVLVGSSAVCTCKVISIWVVSSSSRASIRFCLVTHSTKCIRNEVLGVFCQIPPWLFVGCLGTQVHSFLAKQMSVAYLPKMSSLLSAGTGPGVPIALSPHWANHGVLLQQGRDGRAGGHSCPCNHPVCMDRTLKRVLN